MSSNGLPEQTLNIFGMSYRWRTKWNIPFESFKKGFDVSQESRVLDCIFMCQKQEEKDIAFSLELIVDETSKFSLQVCATSNQDLFYPIVDYASVNLGGEVYFLNCFGMNVYNPLLATTLKEKEENGILSQDHVISVNCLMRARGFADLTLQETVVDSKAATVGELGFAPRNVAFGNAASAAYYLEGTIPHISMDSASFLLQEAERLDLPELRSLVSYYLEDELSKENMFKIMRLAKIRKLTNLQKVASEFMGKYFRNGFLQNNWAKEFL